jgi:hypothetical protein
MRREVPREGIVLHNFPSARIDHDEQRQNFFHWLGGKAYSAMIKNV